MQRHIDAIQTPIPSMRIKSAYWGFCPNEIKDIRLIQKYRK